MGEKLACGGWTRALLTGAAAIAFGGCTSPNTYQTARTLSPGDVSFTLAAEAIGYRGPQGTGALPILPTTAFRIGVVDRVDVGARLGSFTEVGADVKVNMLRGPLDLAVQAGGEAFLEWRYDPAKTRRSGAHGIVHVPVVASINFTKQLSLVATPGFAYVIGKKVDSDSTWTQVFDGGQALVRLGIGLDYRPTKKAALHPEITVLQSTRAPQAVLLFGIGFNLGKQPEYDDVP